MFWYWSLLALVLSAILVTVIGVLAQYYIGKRMMEWLGHGDDARAGGEQNLRHHQTGGRGVLRQQKFVQDRRAWSSFPRAGMYSIGFITSEQHGEVQQKTERKGRLRFRSPTTPIPTCRISNSRAGRKSRTKLDMSVADGIKLHRQPRLDFAGIVRRQESNDRIRHRPDFADTSAHGDQSHRPLAHAGFRAHRDGGQGRAPGRSHLSLENWICFTRRIFPSAAAAVPSCTPCAR